MENLNRQSVQSSNCLSPSQQTSFIPGPKKISPHPTNMKCNDELQNNGKTKSSKAFSVSDLVFEDDMSSTWSEMTPVESVSYNVDTFESPPEIIKLKNIEAYGGVHNYIDSVKCNAEALGLVNDHLDYKISEVYNSSQRRNLHILRTMILNSLSKEDSIIIRNSKTINEIIKCLIERYEDGLENSFQIYKCLLSKKLNINMNRNQIIEFFNDVDSKFLQLKRMGEEISDKVKINLFGSIWIENDYDLVNGKISYLNDCEFIGYNPEYKGFCERIKKIIIGLSLFYSNKNNKLNDKIKDLVTKKNDEEIKSNLISSSSSPSKDALEVSDLNESLNELNSSLVSSKSTDSSTTVTLSKDPKLLQSDILNQEKESMVHSDETMVKSEEVINDSPKPNISTTAVINNDKYLDIPTFDGKPFYTIPKKDLTAQNEIGTVKKKSSKGAQINNSNND